MPYVQMPSTHVCYYKIRAQLSMCVDSDTLNSPIVYIGTQSTEQGAPYKWRRCSQRELGNGGDLERLRIN